MSAGKGPGKVHSLQVVRLWAFLTLTAPDFLNLFQHLLFLRSPPSLVVGGAQGAGAQAAPCCLPPAGTSVRGTMGWARAPRCVHSGSLCPRGLVPGGDCSQTRSRNEAGQRQAVPWHLSLASRVCEGRGASWPPSQGGHAVPVLLLSVGLALCSDSPGFFQMMLSSTPTWPRFLSG